MHKINVLISDSHTYLRKAISNLINMEHNMRVIAEAKNSYETALFIKNYKPDVILLDIDIPYDDGFEILDQYENTNIISKIIIHTMGLSKEIIEKLSKYNKISIVTKESQFEYLISSIYDVAKGIQFVEPKVAGIINSNETNCFLQLTKREFEILKLLGKGSSNLEIATTLFLSEKTVKNHLTSMFKKLNISDRTHAAIYAINNKII